MFGGKHLGQVLQNLAAFCSVLAAEFFLTHDNKSYVKKGNFAKEQTSIK